MVYPHRYLYTTLRRPASGKHCLSLADRVPEALAETTRPHLELQIEVILNEICQMTRFYMDDRKDHEQR